MHRRALAALVLALLVLLAGCNGFESAPRGSATTAPGSTTSQTTPTPTSTTLQYAGPSLTIESTVDALPVHVAIYNSTFVSGEPVFKQTSRLDAGDSLYLTQEIESLGAAHVVVSVNDTEVWNASLQLSKGYRVRVNETDAEVLVKQT